VSGPPEERAGDGAAGGPHGAPDGARLRMRDVVAGYGASDVVLDGLSLAVRPTGITVMLGPNGSGKSTALRALFGLVRIRDGAIELDGADITNVATHERLPLGMALLPQGHSVFPDLTVEENLQLGGWMFGRDKARLRAALERTYEQYPMLADRRGARAGALSGGQQRILEIARLILTDPAILLVDEPSVGLAPVLVDDVYEEVIRLRDLGKTILLVDQNVHAAIDIADYVYILEFGRVKAEGDVREFAGDVAGIVRDWLRI
jgi:branched-chain amino acid transport system ATP-binding protein